MNILNKLSDKEFIPFLQNLGVDTRNQSFEWMLNNPDFAPALEWMYNNLDHSNVLTAREKRRYAEIQKRNNQIGIEPTTDEIDKKMSAIIEQYSGIVVPGDQEALEEMQHNINAQKDRLNLIEKQENIVSDLIAQNEHTNEALNLEITKLNAAQQQATEEEKSTADECIKLAETVETMVDDIIQLVKKNMDFYSTCGDNQESAKKLYTFGPFEQYKQSQDLFQSHFDLYTSKKFLKRQNDTTTDDNAVLIEAKHLEERLSEAIAAYIESKAELSGEQAKLELVSNYTNPHPSQISTSIMEAQAAVQLLEQEEGILEQQIQNAIKEYVEERTAMVEETAANAALAVREQVDSELSYLCEVSAQAQALDTLAYCALRHELRATERFLHFAAQLRHYVQAESHAVATRVDSMLDICSEQTALEEKLEQSDPLLKSMYTILGAQKCGDRTSIVKMHHELKENIKELKEALQEAFDRRKDDLAKYQESSQPLLQYIWSGSTKQPNCTDSVSAALAHALRQHMAAADHRVLHASATFSALKNGDKQQIRKLWQWFLTDPSRLLAALKAAQSGKFHV